MQRSHRLRCIVSNFVVYASKKEDIPFGVSSFLLALRADANLLNATVRWTVARDGLTERNLDSIESLNQKVFPYIFPYGHLLHLMI